VDVREAANVVGMRAHDVRRLATGVDLHRMARDGQLILVHAGDERGPRRVSKIVLAGNGSVVGTNSQTRWLR
jgi:hypothetical protein